MKKFFVMIVCTLACIINAHMLYAQHVQPLNGMDKKTQRDAERIRMKAEQEAAEELAYQKAITALKDSQFVMEADQVVFRGGQTAFVTSNTNFVLVNLKHGTVQIAFNTSYPGPNGIGGVTVDGSISDLKITTDKRDNVSSQFNIQGIGISAQVFLTLTAGNNRATVTISPNFNGNSMTLNGNLLPLNESAIFKGRSW